MPVTQYIFTWRWFSRSCFTGRICGSWHPALGGFWEDSTTGWPAGWRGDNPGEDGAVDGSIPRWRMQWRRKYYRKCRPTYPATITQLHSLLWPGPLFTCDWQRSGDRVQGWPSGGGSRTYCMWMVCGHLFGGLNGRRGWGDGWDGYEYGLGRW